MSALLVAATACSGDGSSRPREEMPDPISASSYEHVVAYQIISGPAGQETVKEKYVPQLGLGSKSRRKTGIEPIADAAGDDIYSDPVVHEKIERHASEQSIGIIQDLAHFCATQTRANPQTWGEVLNYGFGYGLPSFPLPERSNYLGDEFIFERAQTCDVRLARQELLLCVAQHLHDIAGAGGVTDLDSRVDVQNADETRRQIIRFQPQRPADRFILRDLSLVVLAELAKMDATILVASEAGGQSLNCDDAYSDVGEDALFSPYMIWGMNYAGIDNQSVPPDYSTSPRVGFALDYSMSEEQAGYKRLAHRLQILRGAARLEHALVEETIRADAEQVERAASNAADPRAAAGLRWGFRGAVNKFDGGFHDTSDYEPLGGGREMANNYAHTAAILHGRLERFGQVADSSYWNPGICAQNRVRRATDAFYETARTYAHARGRGSPISTPGAARAFSLLSEVGYAPRPNLDSVGTQRTELKALLAARRATGSSGLAFDAAMNAVDELGSADFRQAAEFAFNQAELIFPGKDAAPDSVVGAGPGPFSYHFPGALPVVDAEGSLEAALIDTRFASLCTTGGVLQEGQGMAMQGATGLGVTLARQATRTASLLQGHDPDLGDARLVAAEIQALVGGAWFTASVDGSGDLAVHGFNVRPADLGLTRFGDHGDVGHLEGKMAVVWGPAWMAECAAGLRTFCPEGDLADRVMPAASVALDASSMWSEYSSGSNPLVPGSSAHALVMTFSGASAYAATAFTGSRNDFAAEGGDRLVLVRLPDRQRAGRIIGPLRPGEYSDMAPATVFSTLGASFQSRTKPTIAGPCRRPRGSAEIRPSSRRRPLRCQLT